MDQACSPEALEIMNKAADDAFEKGIYIAEATAELDKWIWDGIGQKFKRRILGEKEFKGAGYTNAELVKITHDYGYTMASFIAREDAIFGAGNAGPLRKRLAFAHQAEGSQNWAWFETKVGKLAPNLESVNSILMQHDGLRKLFPDYAPKIERGGLGRPATEVERVGVNGADYDDLFIGDTKAELIERAEHIATNGRLADDPPSLPYNQIFQQQMDAVKAGDKHIRAQAMNPGKLIDPKSYSDYLGLFKSADDAPDADFYQDALGWYNSGGDRSGATPPPKNQDARFTANAKYSAVKDGFMYGDDAAGKSAVQKWINDNAAPTYRNQPFRYKPGTQNALTTQNVKAAGSFRENLKEARKLQGANPQKVMDETVRVEKVSVSGTEIETTVRRRVMVKAADGTKVPVGDTYVLPSGWRAKPLNARGAKFQKHVKTSQKIGPRYEKLFVNKKRWTDIMEQYNKLASDTKGKEVIDGVFWNNTQNVRLYDDIAKELPGYTDYRTFVKATVSDIDTRIPPVHGSITGDAGQLGRTGGRHINRGKAAAWERGAIKSKVKRSDQWVKGSELKGKANAKRIENFINNGRRAKFVVQRNAKGEIDKLLVKDPLQNRYWEISKFDVGDEIQQGLALKKGIAPEDFARVANDKKKAVLMGHQKLGTEMAERTKQRFLMSKMRQRGANTEGMTLKPRELKGVDYRYKPTGQDAYATSTLLKDYEIGLKDFSNANATYEDFFEYTLKRRERSKLSTIPEEQTFYSDYRPPKVKKKFKNEVTQTDFPPFPPRPPRGPNPPPGPPPTPRLPQKPGGTAFNWFEEHGVHLGGLPLWIAAAVLYDKYQGFYNWDAAGIWGGCRCFFYS